MNEHYEEPLSNWERKAFERLAKDIVREHTSTRRWRTFFKILYFAALFWFLLIISPQDWFAAPENLTESRAHTAMISIKGIIMDTAEASAENIIPSLQNAFKDKNTKGIILNINSPGGSPVQAGYIYDEIIRLKKLHPETKVYAVVTDMGLSGGYYIAAAADEIYVDKASLVGSIGVLMNGFGFVDTLKKLGVERRLVTAGENKAIFDPFSPVKPEDKQFIQKTLNVVHQQFIKSVKDGRGERLKSSPEVFSGLFWTGEEAVQLGLADKLGSPDYVARDVIGEKRIVEFMPKRVWFERFAEQLGASAGQALQRFEIL